LTDARRALAKLISSIGKTYRYELQAYLKKHPVKLNQLHLSRTDEWKLRTGIEDTLETIWKRTREILKDDDVLFDGFAEVFIECQFDAGNYYSIWRFLEDSQALEITHRPTRQRVLEALWTLGRFESLLAYSEKWSEGAIGVFNQMSCRFHLGRSSSNETEKDLQQKFNALSAKSKVTGEFLIPVRFSIGW